MIEKTAVLNLTDCKYWDELHERIKIALDFPDYYGKNWDAFWDCINRECDIDFLTIKSTSKVTNDLKPAIKILKELLEENKKYWADSDCPFDYEIID